MITLAIRTSYLCVYKGFHKGSRTCPGSCACPGLKSVLYTYWCLGRPAWSRRLLLLRPTLAWNTPSGRCKNMQQH